MAEGLSGRVCGWLSGVASHPRQTDTLCLHLTEYTHICIVIYTVIHGRLGKLACPRVSDDQKSGVDDQKLNPSRPHDD